MDPDSVPDWDPDPHHPIFVIDLQGGTKKIVIF
jgi:hypothetical protein